MRRDIRFLRRGREVQLDDIPPTLTLLDYLRLTEHAVGTTEGCADGDCGACTVVLRKRVRGQLVHQPVNACILLAGQADGAEVITVGDLANGAPHPIQQQLADQPAQERDVAKALSTLEDDDVFVGSEASFFAAPATVAGLAKLYSAHPDAVLVGGATDVGLWITKKLQTLPKIIWLGRVRGLDAIEDAPHAVTFGAMVSHESALPHLAAIDPDLGELMRRFAGKQIRTVGTLGGNIANGSPMDDTPPALIALGATLSLQRGEQQRNIALDAFFIAWGTQDRASGEFVRSVRVPKLKSNERFRCYKISQQFDQNISAAMGAFKLTLDGSRIQAARIVFGGMAATPKRASHAEVALAGANLADETTWIPALTALASDFTPITDQPANWTYRHEVARALLYKALIEIGGASRQRTRIVSTRETADATA